MQRQLDYSMFNPFHFLSLTLSAVMNLHILAQCETDTFNLTTCARGSKHASQSESYSEPTVKCVSGFIRVLYPEKVILYYYLQVKINHQFSTRSEY